MASDQVLLQHEHAMRALGQVLANVADVMRLTVPVLWGMKEIRAHYPALSEAQIVALLEKHCGYRGMPGKRPAIHVDQILKLDAILSGRLRVGG